jgi:competence ComEA-like helix-hairpin-helix protein
MAIETTEKVQVVQDESFQGANLDKVADAAIEIGAGPAFEKEIVEEAETQSAHEQASGPEGMETEEKPLVRIDLNTASAQELQTVSGIGPQLSARIVDYRDTSKGFLSKDELLAVPGVGATLYDRIAEQLTVTPQEGAVALDTAPEEDLEVEMGVIPEPIVIPAEPAAEPAAPRPIETRAPGEPRPGTGWRWVWAALLGALLGTLATLVILYALNGSLALSQSPVILDVNNRIQGLTVDVAAVRSELGTVQQRLTLLESLPTRMDAVEDTVGELGTAVDDLGAAVGDLGTLVSDLDQRTGVLSNRLDTAEEDIVVVQQRADQVEGFFQQLQSLLTEVFGTAASLGD